MGAITIIREIKQIHPNYVILVRMGGFYRVYGKDAYILSNIFEFRMNARIILAFFLFLV